MKPQKLALMTIASGEKYQEIWKRTKPYFEDYADRCGADLLVLENIPDHLPSPHWAKFSIYELLKKQYDRIAFIDADILIRSDAPSLFDIVPENEFGIFNEGYYTPRAICLHEVKKVYNVDLSKWDGTTYYNTGVMVVSRCHRHIFNTPSEIKPLRNSFGEQTYLNMRIVQSEVKVHILEPAFNRMCMMDRLTGMTRLDSYFIHYAGFDALFGDGSLLKALDRDIERWKQDAPEYKYKRQIFIWSFGGLGDVISAEPVIRFIRETAYPDDDIYVMTKHPELYRHIKNIRIGDKYPEGEFDAIYEMNTHFVAHEKFHSIVPHPLAHAVDWVSMAIMGRQLTNTQKAIRLEYDEKDLETSRGIYRDIENLVLIHAGKGWETKTFPAEWWKAVADGLRANGMKVGLIGKKLSDEQGYVEFDCNVDADFRDKLTLQELIALIAKAPLLITNDSVPVHIAGAFNNNIILIPTCKHPDYVLPFRHESQSYKAKALYKRILDEDDLVTPTSIKGWKMAAWQVSKFQKNRNIYDYIPDPEKVVEEAFNFLCE
jgi:hypothetical protein